MHTNFLFIHLSQIITNIYQIQMQTQKYERVRADLDRLKFTESLYPQSVDLVARLLHYIEDLSKKVMDSKKRRQTKSNTSRMDNHEFDLLNQKYSQVKAENEQLRRRIEDTGISEKIRLLETKLRQCQIKYESELDERTEKLRESEKQISDLMFVKGSLQEQNSSLKKMMQKSKNENRVSCQNLSELLDKKKKTIQSLEEENSKYRLQLNSLQRLYEQEKQYRNTSQKENDKQSAQIISVLKEQIGELEEKNMTVRQDLQKEEQKSQQLKNTIKQLNDQIAYLQNEGQYAKQSYNIETNAKQKIESLLSNTQNQNQELKEKVGNNEALLQANSKQILRQQSKIKQLIDKNTKIMNNNNRLQQEITILNDNYTQKIRELRESENNRTSLTLHIKQLETNLKSYQESEPLLKNSPNLQAEYNKNMVTLEKQIHLQKNQIKVMQENQHKILSQKTKLEAELKKLTFVIEEGNKELQFVQSQKESLFKENKELKATIESYQNQGYSKNSENIRMKESIQSYQIMIEDLRSAVRNEQNNNRTLNQKINSLQKKIQKILEDNKQTDEDNKQLSLRAAALQKQKNQIWEKYASLKENNVSKDTQNIQFVKQYNELMHEKNIIEKKLKEKQRALVQLDTERDQLQNLLDDKTMENATLVQKIKQLQKQVQNCGKGANQREMNMHGMQNTIKSLEYELEKAQKNIMRLGEELNDCHVALNSRTLECQQFHNEINILVLNNKDQEKTLQKSRDQIANLEKRLRDSNKEIDQYRQNIQIYKIENQNISAELANERVQLERWENYGRQAGEQNHLMYNKLTEKDGQIKQLIQSIRQMQFTIEQQSQQIGRYEKQLRGLGEDLTRKDEEYRRLEKDRDVYRAQAKSSMMRIPDMNEKLYLENRLDDLQNDFMVKKMECENWRQECHKLEKIIEEERLNNFMLNERIDRLQGSGGSIHNASTYTPKYVGRENRNSNILIRSREQDQQTPIKMFDKSRLDSESEQSSIGQSSVDEVNFRNSMNNSNAETIGKSSINSRQMQQNLAEIQRLYNQTLYFKKK